MSNKSNIEWTDASWNPTTGCTKVSAGCLNCYAEKLSKRLQAIDPEGKYKNGFKLTLHPEAIGLPLKWREPKKIFVNSMSDLFHKDIPYQFIDAVWETMMKADWHIYQILTKRPDIMLDYITKRGHKPMKHIWLGTSVENQRSKFRSKPKINNGHNKPREPEAVLPDELADGKILLFQSRVDDCAKFFVIRLTTLYHIIWENPFT